MQPRKASSQCGGHDPCEVSSRSTNEPPDVGKQLLNAPVAHECAPSRSVDAELGGLGERDNTMLCTSAGGRDSF